MRHFREFVYLARDFASVVRGRDYFHVPQGLGRYFDDRRCYYNDLRGKANWSGPLADGVPLLYVPSLKQSIQFPIMILQYGLGSFDRWALEGGEVYRSRVTAVVRWIVQNLDSRGSFRNYFPQWMPSLAFHSDNSGMAQGEALSLLMRAVRYDAVAGPLQRDAELAAERIVANMLLPLEQAGTRYATQDSTYFCELCCIEPHIVLNGWIFALFGLQDYCNWRFNSHVQGILDSSLATLRREVGSFVLPSGWSLYDNRGRIASPFYHQLHVALVEAQHLLAPESNFGAVVDRLRRANTLWNRVRFTAVKIKDKVLDDVSYATAASETSLAAPAQAA